MLQYILTQLSTNEWRYQYDDAGTESPYRIYWLGKLISETDRNTYVMLTTAAEAPVLEILGVDDTDIPVSVTYPPYVRLQWYASTSAVTYKVEEYVDSTWTELDRITPEDNAGYMYYDTTAKTDCTEHTFRVVPIDAYNRDGADVEFTVYVVRHPLPEAVDLTYSAVTGDLTISEPE